MHKLLSAAAAWPEKLPERLRPCRLPFFSALLAGLLAHGFAFANKLPNADELSSLYGKGMTVGSGRWGLELSKYLFPSISTPWIYGLLSLVLLSAAACLMVRIFRIRSPLLIAVLSGLLTVFPAQTATFSYMFTAPSYALALLLVFVSVWFSQRETLAGWLLSLVLLLLGISIYQAYIAFASSFFVILMLQKLLRGEGSAREIFLFGLKRLALLACALLLYLGSIPIALQFYSGDFVDYGVAQETSVFFRALVAYSSFLHTLTRDYFDYVHGGFSRIMHVFALLPAVYVSLRWLFRCRDWGKILLFLLCLLLLPLSMYCIYLIAETGIIHSMVLYSFLSLYVFAVVAAEELRGEAAPLLRQLVALSLALVAAGNVFYANAFYLKLHLRYEHSYALYTGIAAQVRQTPGFDENTKLAILGEAETGLYTMPEMEDYDLIWPADDLTNAYTREYFVERYVGFDVPFADREEKRALKEDPRVQEMPIYPAYGSVQMIDDYLVIRLGE